MDFRVVLNRTAGWRKSVGRAWYAVLAGLAWFQEAFVTRVERVDRRTYPLREGTYQNVWVWGPIAFAVAVNTLRGRPVDALLNAAIWGGIFLTYQVLVQLTALTGLLSQLVLVLRRRWRR